MYYISSNQNIDVVKHSVDEGNKNRIIKDSKIPNQHLIGTMTKKLQGHSLEIYALDFKKNLVWTIISGKRFDVFAIFDTLSTVPETNNIYSRDQNSTYGH